MIGRDLRVLREACGVTVGELADAGGWAPTTLSDGELCSGEVSREFSDEYLAALVEILRPRMPVGVVDAASEQCIAASVKRFRRAFNLAGIGEREVKVSWDATARWCRLWCRLADGRVVERVRHGDATPRGEVHRLVYEMSVWMWRAAKRAKAGQDFVDESALVVTGQAQTQGPQRASRSEG